MSWEKAIEIDVGTEPVNRVKTWLTKPLPYRTAAPIFIVSLALFASAVIPLLVTIDGIVYVANAKSILTPDFQEIYTLYREPGYPLFLKGVHFWGDAGVLLVFAQAALLASAGIMAFVSITRLMGRSQATRWELGLLWIFLANPMFLGYSGTILQQALFTFQLAGFALLLSWAITRPAKIHTWSIAVLTLAWYISAVATSIGWIYLGWIPVSATFFMLVLPKLGKFVSTKKNPKPYMAILVVISIPLAIVLAYTIGRQTYQAWDDFKRPYISQQKTEVYVIKPLESLPNISTPSDIANRTLSLMNMVTIEPYEKENDLFMGIQMRRQTPSSSWDSAWEQEPQASYALNYFVITNPGEILHNGYARLASIASLWYQASFVVMWLLALGLLIKRKWKPLSILVLAPINFLFVYAASNSPIDRYGVPTYVFAATSLVLLIKLTNSFLTIKKRLAITNQPSHV